MSDEYFNPAAYEAAFGVQVCERFARFLAGERHDYDGRTAELPTYGFAVPLWFDGPQLESFVRDDWPDEDDDGMPYGHPSATEIDFEDDFAGWVPLATLDEEESQVLLCRAGEPPCEVALWSGESSEAMPLSRSLDAFLAGLGEG